MLWLTSDVLPLITMAAYFAASIRIVTFRRLGFNFRRCYSLLAGLMVGVTLCAGIEILIFSPKVSFGQCAVSLMFLFAAFRSRGNVASMLRAG